MNVEDERYLSQKLALLGQEREAIYEELAKYGYGECSLVYRKFYCDQAESESAAKSLNVYWTEYAKERLAALRGPLDILGGDIPSRTTYRSVFLQKLRQDIASGIVKSVGIVDSPQIEPTFKRVLESGDLTLFRRLVIDICSAKRRRAVAQLNLKERPDFGSVDNGVRYEILRSRLADFFREHDYSWQRRGKFSSIFRKMTCDQRWEFVCIDNSRKDLPFGGLSLECGLVNPGAVVKPGLLPANAVATIPPEVLIPGIRLDFSFTPESYAELCLAADSSARFCDILLQRINGVLSAV